MGCKVGPRRNANRDSLDQLRDEDESDGTNSPNNVGGADREGKVDGLYRAHRGNMVSQVTKAAGTNRAGISNDINWVNGVNGAEGEHMENLEKAAVAMDVVDGRRTRRTSQSLWKEGVQRTSQSLWKIQVRRIAWWVQTIR